MTSRKYDESVSNIKTIHFFHITYSKTNSITFKISFMQIKKTQKGHNGDSPSPFKLIFNIMIQVDAHWVAPGGTAT